MENKAASSIIGSADAPYTSALARRYGVAEASYAITHPSLPNYMALTSGSTDGITADCWPCTVPARNLVDQLAGAGVSWRAYLESVPAACYRGEGSAGYAAKHNPFIHYRDVAGSPSRCARLVGFAALQSDLRRDTLPSFVWITPNLCDDTHDCGVSTGDRFLARTVPPLLRELGPHGFLVITWDEGVGAGGCCAGAAAGGRIATIVAGPDVRPGARSREPLDHYGVLATIEQAFDLGRLGAATNSANGTLDPLFRVAPRLRG